MGPLRSTRARVASVGLAVAMMLAVFTGCAADTGDTTIRPVNVLFIGNSFTENNGGIDADLRGLAPRITVVRSTTGGYSLSDHLADRHTTDLLTDRWDFVVVQEQSQRPIYDQRGFAAAAADLSARIKSAHATPVLLATWGRPDSPGVTNVSIQRAVARVAAAQGAKIIPAGAAFSNAQKADPTLKLNVQDGHPTREGTYLAACTAYAELFGKSPVGNTYTGGLNPDAARVLQQAAAAAAAAN